MTRLMRVLCVAQIVVIALVCIGALLLGYVRLMVAYVGAE